MATELEYLKENHQHPFGHIVQIHEIGPYAVVEYRPKRERAASEPPRETETMFSSYVHGKRTITSHDTLDAALAHCIAVNAEGNNTMASFYFMRMLAGS